MMKQTVVEEIWRRHKEWSATAGVLKSSIVLWRTVVLFLSIGGAFFATFASQISAGFIQQLIAWAGAALLAMIPIITPRQLSATRTRTWTRARSASEGMKTELYMYLSHAAPYDGSSTDSLEILRKRTQEIEQSVLDLAKYLAKTKTKHSPPPKELNANDYLQLRVAHQIDWYLKNAGLYADKSSRFRNAELILAVTAALLAASAGIWEDTLVVGGSSIAIGAWVAVLTTIGGTLTAHIAASRFDHLVTIYTATAFQLRNLVMQWPPKGGGTVPSPQWSEFVRNCEDAISKENESWMAKWTKQ